MLLTFAKFLFFITLDISKDRGQVHYLASSVYVDFIITV